VPETGPVNTTINNSWTTPTYQHRRRHSFTELQGTTIMYAITGITGKVGGAVAEALLAAGLPVRAVVRDAAKGQAWATRGCQVALAEMNDADALALAFKDCEAVFVLPPSEFDPALDFAEAVAVIDAVTAALLVARPARVVCLSTIGAQAVQTNLLSQRTLMERALQDLAMPVTFLRPAWFMENALWDVAGARAGLISSFLQPLDRPVAMVATADVGRVAAELLQQSWRGVRVVELSGPRSVSPNDIAATFAAILGHPVRAEAVPRSSWEALFRSQGSVNPLPRMRMLDGFNEGWIAFAGDEASVRKGNVELDAVLRQLVSAS
jgi:NAD(P)H dehydrogenase (quinone)